MKPDTSTAFKFIDYRVSRFSYQETGKKNDNYDLEIFPTGIYDTETAKYELTLSFFAKDKEDTDFIIMEVVTKAVFEFETKLNFDDIPDFFYNNSVAILFPYVRAFISTMSMQANTKDVIVLGLMKFGNVSENLKNHTIVKQFKKITE